MPWCVFDIFLSHLQVAKLVLINASVYAEVTGDMAKLPKIVAYAGVGFHIQWPVRKSYPAVKVEMFISCDVCLLSTFVASSQNIGWSEMSA